MNLDYKLREELRSELREIFRHGTTTVVYATTEPQEALLFGGNTLLLDAGRVLQSGPALEIYHRPATIRASQVFSDPPINLINAVIGPQGCRLSPSVAFPLAPHMRALPAAIASKSHRRSHRRSRTLRKQLYALLKRRGSTSKPQPGRLVVERRGFSRSVGRSNKQ